MLLGSIRHSPSSVGSKSDSTEPRHAASVAKDPGIDALIHKVRGLTGVASSHLAKLQSFASEQRCLIGIRPVDRLATDLIEDGHPTKGFHIKGKSANWGPQAAFICVDQRLSKLENGAAERIGKFNEQVNDCMRDGYARKVPLTLGRARLQKLLSEGLIEQLRRDRHGVVSFEARAPSGAVHTFEAAPTRAPGEREERFEIRLGGKAVEVLAPPHEGAKPLTADYDLFVIAPRIESLGPEDNLPVPDVSHDVFRARLDRYRSGVPRPLEADYAKAASFYRAADSELGNVSERVRKMIPMINEALVGGGEPVVHHGADDASPAADPSANYPLTFALPEKIGSFDEICVVKDKDELAELVGSAKAQGYHVPLNPLWEREVNSVRRTAFVEARERVKAYFGG